MNFELNEEQRMFKDAIRNFAEKEIAPLISEAEGKETFPIQLFPKMGVMGYLCVGYPPEYGGGGMGEIGECIATEELGRICLGIASGIMVQSGIATSAIYRHGNEEQRQKYLVPAIKGQKIGPLR